MQGFLVTDYAPRFGEAIGDLVGWVGEGKIRDRVDVVEGLENASDALRRLFTGDNLGKQLVHVADPGSSLRLQPHRRRYTSARCSMVRMNTTRSSSSIR